MGKMDRAIEAFQQKDYETAVMLFQELYQENLSQLGQAHPDTLSFLGNYAAGLFYLGRFTESYKAYLKRYQICKMHLDEIDTEIPALLEPMCAVVREQLLTEGFDLARINIEELLSVCKQDLTDTHPYTLELLYLLGLGYYEMQDYGTAKELFLDVYAERKEVLGDGHITTIQTLSQYASTLFLLDEFEQALETYEKSYRQYCDLLGDTSEEAADELFHMGTVLLMSGDPQAAISKFSDVCELRKTRYGESNGKTMQAYLNLAMCYLLTDKVKEGIELARVVYEYDCMTLGESNPETLRILMMLQEYDEK